METGILWEGLECQSLENCLITTTGKGFHVNSIIIGNYNNIIYRVQYQIDINRQWEITHCDIETRQGGGNKRHLLHRDNEGNWILNNRKISDLEGCFDMDLSLSPFTNTLPIKRLDFARCSEQQIKVIYFDLLDDDVSARYQKYNKVSDNKYHYENIPNDFEAEISVDGDGYVVDYPGLFRRVSIVNCTSAEGS